MASYERNYTTLQTPLGLSGFANVTKESNFGGFEITLFMDSNSSEVQEFLETLQQIHNGNMEYELGFNEKLKIQDLQDTSVRDNDPDQFRGGEFVRIRLKSKNPPAIVDSQGNKVQLSRELPVGSTIRARITAASWNYMGKTGTSLYLNAIQIGSLGQGRTKKGGDTTNNFGTLDGDFVGVGTNADDLDLG